jgi:acyl carrier protein
MTDDDLTRRVLDALVRVAPEIDPAHVPPDAVLRDEYDIDSMDFLNFVIGLHDAFGIDVPEADYPALATLAGAIRYVREHTGPPPSIGASGRSAVHRFEAALSWVRGGEPGTASNHTATFAGRPPLPLSAPPQFAGDAARLSPEELFMVSVASCQLLTYLALAARAGVVVVRYDDRPAGTLARVERRMRMTEVTLRPRIVLAAGGDVVKARGLVDAAHDACFVANSITARVVLAPEVVVA